MLVDTHCHLHFSEKDPQGQPQLGYDDVAGVLERAHEQGVETIINVGVTPDDSRAAIRLAANPDYAVTRTGVRLYASAGLHPHEAYMGDQAVDLIHDMADDVIAIGECGLDYFKNKSPRDQQEHVLRAQIEIALQHNLPLIFHVRDAWDDFIRILTDYPKVRGVVHSFTGHVAQVDALLKYSDQLYFGLNGIMTFTRDDNQLAAAKHIPSERLLLETDAPFLSPVPNRGKRNEPSGVVHVANFLAELRGQSVSNLADVTTGNARHLFGIE